MGRTTAFQRDAGSAPINAFRSAAVFTAFMLLAAFNVVRTFRHAMWRDELQAFMLAAGSPTLVDLFHNLKYEAHPALWYAMLWLVTRFTTEPAALQILHVAIALGVWALIFRASPFSGGEKFLLVLSYFLFWEYFVVSRSYALMTLLGFAFVALRAARPRSLFLPWFLLGLLANTIVFGAIWSMAMAAFLAWRAPWHRPGCLLGGVTYVVLLAVAVLTMTPAPDMVLYQTKPRIDLQGIGALAAYPLDSFIPLFQPWLSATMRWLGALQLAPSDGVDPKRAIVSLLALDAHHLVRLSLLLLLPIGFCWLVVRDFARTAEFAAAYGGVLLFAQLWHYAGAARHHGVVFVMLVAAAWAAAAAPAAMARAAPARWLWLAFLLVSAAGGLTTLSSELHPYSEGRNVATWLQRNGMQDAPIVGSVDFAISPVAGYLGRPIYYLECECPGTFIVWNSRRKWPLDAQEIVRRTRRAVEAAGWSNVLLILNADLMPQLQAAAPDLAFEILERFPNAVARPDENYVVYRVRMR